MAYYLVRAKLRQERLEELKTFLHQGAFLPLRPFGEALTGSLREARIHESGDVIWEEEDYCSPPLAEERAAVLDKYFDDISVQKVARGEGWECIKDFPRLFSRLPAP